MKHQQLYLSFDPGDRWVGVALALVTKDEWRVESAVLDCRAEMLRAAGLLETCLSSMAVQSLGMQGADLVVVCEDFRVRPQKHNTFDHGRTLRLLGALEYVATRQFTGVAFELIPAGNADHELPLLAIGATLGKWAKRGWKPSARTEWQHARSAWRALARYLLTHQPGMLKRFAREAPDLIDLRGSERLFWTDEGDDLKAAPATWSWA